MNPFSQISSERSKIEFRFSVTNKKAFAHQFQILEVCIYFPEISPNIIEKNHLTVLKTRTAPSDLTKMERMKKINHQVSCFNTGASPMS
jgi:hypothetical protein